MGHHMASNIVGVIEAVKNLNSRSYTDVKAVDLLKAIKDTSFEGRFERIDDWILDGAHNHASLMALKDTLDMLNYKDLIGVFACLKDKDFDEALKALKPYFKKMILTEADSFRKLAKEDLYKKMSKLTYDQLILADSLEDAYKKSE